MVMFSCVADFSRYCVMLPGLRQNMTGDPRITKCARDRDTHKLSHVIFLWIPDGVEYCAYWGKFDHPDKSGTWRYPDVDMSDTVCALTLFKEGFRMVK